jgi:mannosyltransferase
MAGLSAGVLLALNAFIVQFAQTARSYGLVVLLVTLSCWFFVLELERPAKWNRIGYVLASALAFGTHFFAATVLAAHALVLLALRRSGALTRTWLGMGAAIAILCAPTVWRASRTNAAAAIDWIQRPTAGDVVRLLDQFAGRHTLLMVALLTLGGVAIVAALRRHPGWPVGFVAAWFTVPIVLSLAVSMVKPVFVSYYLIVCVPAFVLLAAAGIAQLRPHVMGVLAASLLAILSGSRVVAYYGREVSENWREATRFVLAEQQPGDAIMFFPAYAPASFAYYVRRQEVAGPTHQGRPLSGEGRIWLAIRASDSTGQRAGLEQLRLTLQERYLLEQARAFRGVALERYAPRPVP